MTRDEIVAWVRFRTFCADSKDFDTSMGDAFRRVANVHVSIAFPAIRPKHSEPEPEWERLMCQRYGALDREN